MLECMAMYNQNKDQSQALRLSNRETFVLGVFHQIDDDGVKFAVSKVLESVEVVEFQPEEIKLFLENLYLKRSSAIVNRILASLIFVLYKMAVVAFDKDYVVSGGGEWSCEREFREDYFHKATLTITDQFKRVLSEEVQLDDAGKREYEQAMLKFLSLTFEFQQTRQLLLEKKDCILHPMIASVFKAQQDMGDIFDDRNLYPELIIAGWEIGFAMSALPMIRGKHLFRALHHVANSLMGIHRSDRSQQLRYQARKNRLVGTKWHQTDICLTMEQLMEFEAEMWPYDPFGYTSAGAPPQQQHVPVSWSLEEPDCFANNQDDQYTREALADEIASVYMACHRSVCTGNFYGAQLRFAIIFTLLCFLISVVSRIATRGAPCRASRTGFGLDGHHRQPVHRQQL